MDHNEASADVLGELFSHMQVEDVLRSAARVSTAWRRAAEASRAYKHVEAKITTCKGIALLLWLKRRGAEVETLAVHSKEQIPLEPEERMFYMGNEPIDVVPLLLPCGSLPKLSMLRLFNVDPTLTDLEASRLPATLTSLKACESPNINIYLTKLTGLRQLSLSDLDYPTGELHKLAAVLTGLTRLRLEWTGDPGWEYKGATMYGGGFSRNGRYYEPGCEYEDAAAPAFTEDATFLSKGFPALQEVELGAYTFMRGEEALNRRLHCGTQLPPGGTEIMAEATAEAAAARGGGAGSPSAAGAPAAPPGRQALRALKVANFLDISGLANMIEPCATSLTRLELSLLDMRSLDSSESFSLLLALPRLKAQLAHLDVGSGILADGLPARMFGAFAQLTALTHLDVASDGGPVGAMSAMFSGGPGSMPRLRSFECSLNKGFRQLGGDTRVKGLLDLRALAAACPNLEALDLDHQHGGAFAQDAARSAAAASRALRGLSALTSLRLRTGHGAECDWGDSTFDDIASLAQLRRLSLDAFTPWQEQQTCLTWPRLAKLSALTALEELEAKPLIKVVPKWPWQPPPQPSSEAGGAAGGARARQAAPAGPDAAAGSLAAGAAGAAAAAGSYAPVALHELLAAVAGSKELQRHAAELVRGQKEPLYIKPEDPGW